MRRLLLFILFAHTATSAVGQPCSFPSNFTNTTRVIESDIYVDFGTDEKVYSNHDKVVFHLIVTNYSAQTFHMNWGIDPQNVIFVLPDSCASVAQPCPDNAVFFYPEIVYYFSVGTTLEPGECRQWTVIWDMDEWWDGPPPNATYNVFGGMAKIDFGPPLLVDMRMPQNGAMVQITVDSSSPVETLTWGAIKSLYDDGGFDPHN